MPVQNRMRFRVETPIPDQDAVGTLDFNQAGTISATMHVFDLSAKVRKNERLWAPLL